MTNVTQRWKRDGGGSIFLPLTSVINPREYEVGLLESDAIAKAFVVTRHYSKSYVAARYRAGLYRKGRLVGVAVFSVPVNQKVLTSAFPCEPEAATELGRLVIDPEVGGNGCSWFLARAFELLKGEGILGVVSFSDPVPRLTTWGEVRHVGHVGTAYQSLNAIFTGTGTKRKLSLLPDGRVMSERAISKIRKKESGWRYAAALLEECGAPPAPEEPELLRQWLALQRVRLRRLAHPGNYRYLFPLVKGIRRHLPESLSYPKFIITRAERRLMMIDRPRPRGRDGQLHLAA